MISFLKKAYPDANNIDSIIPINENVNVRKPIIKTSEMINREITHKRIIEI